MKRCNKVEGFGELKKRGAVNLLTDRRAGIGVSAGGNGEELSGDKTSLKC